MKKSRRILVEIEIYGRDMLNIFRGKSLAHRLNMLIIIRKTMAIFTFYLYIGSKNCGKVFPTNRRYL